MCLIPGGALEPFEVPLSQKYRFGVFTSSNAEFDADHENDLSFWFWGPWEA